MEINTYRHLYQRIHISYIFKHEFYTFTIADFLQSVGIYKKKTFEGFIICSSTLSDIGA